MEDFWRQRWLKLWEQSAEFSRAEHWLAKLLAAYQEPQRKYHGLHHLLECLLEFDNARHLAESPKLVELAIWFHDSVYQPKAADNEEQSSAWARECLNEANYSDGDIHRVVNMVLSTKHHLSSDPDTNLLLDIDLAILGRDETRFAEYESQIAAEYDWVLPDVYREKRLEVLAKFLSREQIYNTDLFQPAFEKQARTNLRKSIEALQSL